MKSLRNGLAGVAVAALVLTATAVGAEKSKKEVGPVLNRQMKSLDGKSVDLSKYHGKVVLIVNTASECGLTPQYEDLQELHKEFGKQGLAVLGFPCNQFGEQEPGDSKQIAEFCTNSFGVTFDMFSKIEVNGETRDDLYKVLTSHDVGPAKAGDITWNFEKFLLNRQGQVVARYAPATNPRSDEVVGAIKKELGRR